MYVIGLQVPCTSRTCSKFHVRRAFETIYPGPCPTFAAVEELGCNISWPHFWAGRTTRPDGRVVSRARTRGDQAAVVVWKATFGRSIRIIPSTFWVTRKSAICVDPEDGRSTVDTSSDEPKNRGDPPRPAIKIRR